MKTKLSFISLALFCALSLSAQKRESSDFAVKNPDKTFVGAVMEYKSINADEHRFVNVTVPEPITISFSLPVMSQTIMPSYENMMKTVRESVVASGKIKQQQSFSYQLKEMEDSYYWLPWYLKQTINMETFFGIPLNAKPQKTSVVVDITQVFFTVGMDMPQNGKLYDKDPEVNKRKEELVYIHSLSFGRKITMIVEAEQPFLDIKFAIEESLNSKGKPISEKNRAILANADIRIIALGNPVLPEMSIDNPFASVLEYFNRPVTIDDFGVPIQVAAAYVKDNSMFINEY